MKKTAIVWITLALLLTGCQTVPTFETLGNIEIPNLTPTARQISVQLPMDASVHTVRGEDGMIYFCDGYEIVLETVSAGDLDRTLRSVTGFCKDALTVLSTQKNTLSCYECVWTSAGESGDQIGRTSILDDGSFHYCLSVTAAAEDAGSLQTVWQEIFDSFALV